MNRLRRFPLSALIAVLTSVLGIAINIATGLEGNAFAWSTVIILTMLVGGLSAVLERRQQPEPDPPPPQIPPLLMELLRPNTTNELQMSGLEIELRNDGTQIFKIEWYSHKNHLDAVPGGTTAEEPDTGELDNTGPSQRGLTEGDAGP
ncbi:hypothetical protein ACRYCC_31030 [Actinomadura scrupuli]|uniref:hypothetical protein n=1 Tax=Actinomadura scrupuli TaxID=559629 RepID=UPI003D95CAC9